MNFKEYLLFTGKPESTANKYSGAINNRLSKLVKKLNDLNWPEDLLNNFKVLCEKLDDSNEIFSLNQRGNNMYSVALSHYHNFISKDFTVQIGLSYSDTQENRLKRISKMKESFPRTKRVESSVYERSPDIVAEVLHRSNGHCELCSSPAPFNRKSDNSPYLEVHHKIWLSNGGEDSIENAIALCPNCHRREHFGDPMLEQLTST